MGIFITKKEGLTQADGNVQIPIGVGDGEKFHQVQIITEDVVGTVRFRLRTPGCPDTFTPVDEYSVEVEVDFSKVNRVVTLCGFTDLIEVVPTGISGTYSVYTCSGGE